jgi:hypothetical protein
VPRADEHPFLVLLEDDRQVTRLVVEADTLLSRADAGVSDSSEAKLVITVEIRPYYITSFNLSFT